MVQNDSSPTQSLSNAVNVLYSSLSRTDVKTSKLRWGEFFSVTSLFSSLFYFSVSSCLPGGICLMIFLVNGPSVLSPLCGDHSSDKGSFQSHQQSLYS